MSSSKLAELLEPMFDKVAILVETKSEFTPQGLYIPLDTARSVHEGERATQGEVVAIGPDVDTVELGWIVVFGKYTGTKIKWKEPLKEGATQEETKAWNSAPHETIIIMTESSILTRLLDANQAKNLKVRG